VIWTWQRGRAVVQGRRGEGFASRVWIHFCCGSRGQAWDSLSLLFLRFLCFLFFISSWDRSDDSFIFSWVLWSLGCKSTGDLSSSFSAFRKKTLKSCQGRRVSWPCLTPCHVHFHQGCIIWGYDQLGSSRVCKDARIFMKVASKKFLVFEIQFIHLCLLCAYRNNASQAIWDTLLWGLAQVIINCIHYF
jgi:hypothetical protein